MLSKLVLAAVLLPLASAYTLGAAPRVGASRAHVTMGMFDGFAKAFENDSTLGDRKDAGLTKGAQKRTVTWMGPNGKKKQALFVPGQKMREVARGSGIPIKYDCSEGSCKTCEAMCNGGRTKVCVARMPNKDTTIKYNLRF